MMTEVCQAPGVGTPRITLPPGAWDCHTHIFGPFDRFPPGFPSVYALPDAGLSAHDAVRATLGFDHAVLIQPGPYGADPSAMLAAIAASRGRLRGVAVAPRDADETLLRGWADQGIRGLRFVDMRAPGGGRYPGSIGFDALTALAPSMRKAGLHAQLWGSTEQIAAALPDLRKLGVVVVIDHLAMVTSGQPANDAAARDILAALSDDYLWMKLSTCRVARTPEALASVKPFFNAVVARAAMRCLWGSDWPFVRLDPPPDAAVLIDLFHLWVEDEDTRLAILSRNPLALFDNP